MTTATASRTSNAWHGFAERDWRTSIDVADFVRRNRTPFEGDASFLSGPTERTGIVWGAVSALFPEERARGIYDVDTHTPAGDHRARRPGYIDQDRELIVGLQTDAPLKRAIMPNGGLRMVEDGLAAYGYERRPAWSGRSSRSTARRTTTGSSTPTRRRCGPPARPASSPGCPTPTAAAGSSATTAGWRCTAWTGSSRPSAPSGPGWTLRPSTEDVIRDREELAEQIRALGELAEMARVLRVRHLRVPPTTAQEAVQWLYFGYLAAVKEQNGAAMSLGRTSTFLDVYLQRDIAEGRLDEAAAQELIDDFVIKLRIVRFLRTPEYDALFSGDPTWVTEAHRRDRRRTAGRWSPARASGSCRPCTTSGRRRSPT